jgi:ribosomal subunit interface protein
MNSFDINSIQLTIQVPGMATDDPLRDFLLSHVEKLGRRFDRIHRCDIVLKEEKSNDGTSCHAEIKVDVPGQTLFASARDARLRIAAQGAFDDLATQLDRFKARLKEKRVFT